jgi:pSer/pThr/pTyr-binding forkhead associated (FHA) protein
VSQEKSGFDAEATLVKDHSVHSDLERRGKFPRLEQVTGPGAPRVIELLADEFVVGRSSQAGLCIESTLLSRRHVTFRRQGAEHRMLDLESANGVFLNGIRVHSAVLHEGDTIQIGDAVLVFHEGSS